MPQILDIRLSNGNYTFAWIKKFNIYSGERTLSGVKITFQLSIESSDSDKENELILEKVEIDVSVNTENDILFVGRLRDNLSNPRLINYEKDIQQELEITHQAYWKLIDLTHYKDLELDFTIRSNAIVKTKEGNRNFLITGNGRGNFPHSEWLKVLNRGEFDKFEIITLRRTLSPLGKDKAAYDESFNKLREAQNCFSRGDWNSVGSQCRAAWRVIKTLIPEKQQPQAIELLLASVIGDPRRKEFGNAVVKGTNDILNKATHLEGDSATQIPPADLQREDALLCLHWTAATISYVASVYK